MDKKRRIKMSKRRSADWEDGVASKRQGLNVIGQAIARAHTQRLVYRVSHRYGRIPTSLYSPGLHLSCSINSIISSSISIGGSDIGGGNSGGDYDKR